MAHTHRRRKIRASGIELVSPATAEVLDELCATGATQNEIAKQMNYHRHSINYHFRRAYEASDTSNPIMLALWWEREGRVQFKANQVQAA